MTNIFNDIAKETQYVFGTEGVDAFRIDASISEYCYDLTDDGGIVVWNTETGSHDIVYNVEQIHFNDCAVELKDGQLCKIDLPQTGDNAAPDAVDDMVTGAIGEVLQINPLSNDTDSDGKTLIITQINGVDMQPGWSTWVEDLGLVKLNSDYTIDIEPVNGVTTASFDYTIADESGNTDTAKVCVELEDTGKPTSTLAPEAQDDKASGVVGQPITLNPLDNDSDADSTQLTITQINGVDMLPGWSTWVEGVGVVTLNADYSVTVEAAEGVAEAGFEYTVSDESGNTDTANICVDVSKPADASLGDRVWNDANGNGIQDDGEAGIAGVTVQLKDVNGNVIESTTTDDNGNYLFDCLEAGEYSVAVVTPDGYKITAKDALANGQDAKDSDVDAQTGMSDTVTLAAGESNLTVDAGLVKTICASFSEDATSLTEGQMKELNVTLSQAVTEDTTITLKVNELTANLADADVKLYTGYMWGDDYGTFYYGNEDDKNLNTGIYSQIQQQRYNITQEELEAIEIGVDKAVNDFHIVDADGNIIDVAEDGTFQVTVKAGESVSDSFKVNALRDMHLAGAHYTQEQYASYQEGSENFNIEIVSVEGAALDCEADKIDVTIENHLRYHTPSRLTLMAMAKIGVTGETSSHEKGDAEIGRTVEFDIDADGQMDTIEWFDGSGDGILVDMSKIGEDGSIDGSALFGDEGGKYTNGYDKLATHDANGDGVVSGDELANFGVWVDDGDAVLEAGGIAVSVRRRYHFRLFQHAYRI